MKLLRQNWLDASVRPGPSVAVVCHVRAGSAGHRLAGVTAAATLAWLSPALLACVALGLLGFFLGPIFPATMAIAPRLTPARLVPTAIGVMNAASVIGGATLPWLAGTVAQNAGMWCCCRSP